MSLIEARSPECKDALSPPRCCVAHAWLSADVYALLQRAADRRRVHVDELVRLIVLKAVGDAVRSAGDVDPD